MARPVGQFLLIIGVLRLPDEFTRVVNQPEHNPTCQGVFASPVSIFATWIIDRL